MEIAMLFRKNMMLNAQLGWRSRGIMLFAFGMGR
jgi:hypothetical protein